MLALLRHSRTMALAMVLLTPGIAGSAVQWLHACPAEEQSAAAHAHGDQSQSDSGHSQGCECIGTCSAAGPVTPAQAVTTLMAAVLGDRIAVPPPGYTFIPAGTPAHLLPPATAPPLG